MSGKDRVVAIEWNHDDTVHQIWTTEDDDLRYLHEHDVNWHEDQGFIHKSGGGPGPSIFLSGKVEGRRGKLWAAPEVVLKCWRPVIRGMVTIARDQVHEIGYDLVEKFPGDPRNDYIEEAGYCCSACDDR